MLSEQLSRRVEAAFKGQFMQPEITGKKWWWQVETDEGTLWFPVLEYAAWNEVEDLLDVDKVEGYGARLSAPGYLDSTEWHVYQTADEAAEELLALYGNEYE